MNSFIDTMGVYTLISIFLLIVIKNVQEVQKYSNTGKSPFTTMLSLSVLIAFFPIAVIIVIIFALYRQIISFVLKVKYGSKFVGLVRGSDAMHATDKPTNGITHILSIFEFDHKQHPGGIFEITKQCARNYMDQHSQKLPKFQSLFLKYMGYHYMLKEEVTVDECVKKMDIVDCQENELNQEEFMKLLSCCYNSPLPRNETIFWDVLVGTQPIKWKENVIQQGIKYYPVLFRNHHCVADGVALLKLWAGVFADKQNVKLVHCKEVNISKDASYNNDKITIFDQDFFEIINDYCKNILKPIQLVLMNLYVVLVAPASIYVNFWLKSNDINILHGPPLVAKEILALSIDQSDNYILKVKKIKNTIPGTSFPEVLLAAFSASLEEYFQMNSTSVPEYITTAVPLVSGSQELHHLVPGELEVEQVQFENSFSIILLDLPIFINQDKLNENTPLINRLQLLKNQTNIIKNSMDYQVNYLLMSVVFPILPQPLVRLLVRLMQCTVTASIMPGPSKMVFARGALPVADCAFWVPHLKGIGVSFSVLTYDKRLQVAFGADKALIPDQKSAQSIVDGVYRHLDSMEKELKHYLA